MPRKQIPPHKGQHSPLDELERGAVTTAGRLKHVEEAWKLENAHQCVPLEPDEVLDGALDSALVRVRGEWTGEALVEATVHVVSRPGADQRPALGRERQLSLGDAAQLRAEAVDQTRAFFDERGFLEVETPHRVGAPGTDVYLDPAPAPYCDEPDCAHERRLEGYLHTSPEFSMKRMLAEGFERIWQMATVWRNGEVGPLHNPEFTLLEWYRAWEPADAIIDDVEALTCRLLAERDLARPFERVTMQRLVDDACGFDLLDALTFDELYEACADGDLLSENSLERARSERRWDELFFELQVTHLEPALEEMGAVFVTDWPAPLAVLAREKPGDERVAERFELYVDGVELANGFQELTDPDAQRERFERDLEARKERGLPDLPMPERLLEAMRWGLPPSTGVAVGFDRLLMLAAGVDDIREVLPFAMRRDVDGRVRWG